jgi:hypothetical protein
MEQPKGPFCQSCGMPMGSIDCFGTNADKTQNDTYCCHCFYDGEFTNPNITLEEMIDLVVSIMIDKVKMPEEQIRQMSQSFIPTLKRWKK